MKTIILTILIFLGNICLYGQLNKGYSDKYFRSISVNQGLSQSTVFTVAQDSLGFMWMGTQFGLNRYDGDSFKVFLPGKNNKNSLQSDYIKCLFVDRKGLIWIGGNKGISSYNYKLGTFKNYHLPLKPGEWLVTSITYDENHKIWASTSFGNIYYLDEKTNEFKNFPVNLLTQDNFQIWQLLFHNGLMYIGTDYGLRIIDYKANRIVPSPLNDIKSRVNNLLLDQKHIWIATEGEGIYNYHTGTKQFVNYRHRKGDNSSLVDNDVRSVRKDNDGNFWIGTFNGLSILNEKDQTFKNYFHSPTNAYTISQNSVRYIYRDRQGGMWMGTFYGGVNYYHKDDIKFNLLDQFTSPLALNDQVVNVIKEDPAHNIWIGTNDKGLNFWNRKNNRMTYLTYDENKSNTISSDNIKAIEFDNNGNALVGTHNSGLNHINGKSGKITHFFHRDNDPSSIAGDMVYALVKDRKNRIWVGTWSGLDQFHPETNTFTHHYLDKLGQRLSSDQITFLMEDSKNRIWIGTHNGVNIFYPEGNKFEIFKSNLAINNLVWSMTEDKMGRIWVGARDGLSYFDEEKRTFIPFSSKENLTQEVIDGLQADNEGNLWVSVKKGLLKINPSTKKIELFDNRNGLGKNQFGLSASFKTHDGMILFGGLNGLCYFYPKNAIQKVYDLSIKFTALELLNTPVLPNDAYGILDHHINEEQSVTFPYDYKQFSLYFNTFNYIAPNKITYYHLLEGFDVDWQKCDIIPKATYANLKPGNYTLRVKAVGPLGEISSERSIEIIVAAPWWRSTWFICIILAFIASATYMAYIIIADRLKTRQQLKSERVDREKIEYINNMKMEFFTNISHEFRTPLTLLIAPLEDMINAEKPQQTIKRNLKLMLANAKRLYHLVDQLLEFRKTELGTRKLRVKKGDLVSFTNDIYTLFIELSKRNHIKYAFKSTEARISCYFDADALEKILINLLSNAFKHTHPEDQIEIKLSCSDQQVLIKVYDSGVGIAPEDQQKIFERFYQINRSENTTGSGLGLSFTKSLVELHHGSIEVDSTLGKGTEFTIRLPLDKQYLPEEYQQDEDDNHYQIHFDNEEINEGTSEISATEQAAEVYTLETEAPQGSKECLLIVDDNYEIVDYLSSYFGKRYKIYTAMNGAEAMSILEETPLDLIISDVMMPEMDGISFCRKIKKNINTSHIPIILLTAKNETAHQIKGFEVGADDYVVKPFSTPLLEVKIQNILRTRKRLKEYYSNSREVVPENIALNSVDEDFLNRVIATIERNIEDPSFSVAKLCDEIAMSRSNLYLKLKAITDESTLDFIKRIRFKKALELLQSKRYTVGQVAYMAGFSSPSYFSTAFKQYYGYLPTAYNDIPKN